MWKRKIGYACTALLLLACDKNKDKSTDVPLDSLTATESSIAGSSSSNSDSNFVGVGKGVLLDNFELGSGLPLVGRVWYTWTDQVDGGGSVISNLDSVGQLSYIQPGYFSKKALSLAFTFDKGKLTFPPYIGFGLVLDRGESAATSSLAAFGGISYYYKGAAHSVRVDASDVLDYDLHVVALPAARVWTKVALPFANFTQEGWGKYVALVKEHILNISWQVKGTSGKSDSLVVDNVYLGDTSEIKSVRLEDLGAPKAAEIPTVTPLASILITNPMQALATKLDRGINITNWLEEASSPFTGFKYNESDVQNWARNGFKALRLPVDLDQYVVNKAGYLSAAGVAFAVNDSLFAVLDSFELWTARNKMSLTIDYHEYDKGFTTASSKDPIYVSMMTRLWQSVAHHFATNTRDDIFYELYNEPDNTINPAVWGAVAQGMVDSIRTQDTTHAILFGDVSWYGVSSLVNRKPLVDNKMIYAIHYYEPFIFTHQGASWTDVNTIHGVMFPYDPAKWSTSSADLGVQPTTPAYVKTQIATYYKNGNKEALMIQFQRAKSWAVTNNVPVILNEFGVYDRVADNVSRLNFYRAITDACTQLEIPWQHWGIDSPFGVLTSSNGNLQPGMKNALGM